MIQTYFQKPTLQDCHNIAQGIMEENAKKPHMMPVTGQELMEVIETHGGTALYIKESIIAGFIKIVPVIDDIYEWGSLFVREEFRGQWLSYTLIESILTTYHDRALMCVTNVPQVIQTCWRLAQIEIQAHEMKKSILEIIESWQPLLEDDHIFWNRHFIERVKV